MLLSLHIFNLSIAFLGVFVLDRDSSGWYMVGSLLKCIKYLDYMLTSFYYPWCILFLLKKKIECIIFISFSLK